MKNTYNRLLIIITIALCLVLFCCPFVVSADGIITYTSDDPIGYGTVYTPRGTPVDVVQYEELTGDQYMAIEYYVETLFPEVTYRGDPTYNYNCHSYAWYLQDIENTWWMNNPSPYYLDGSYNEVSVPEEGDIICYYNSLNENIHSGIIIDIAESVTSGNISELYKLRLISKWGRMGLYEHYGNYCPYLGEGQASYVKYYRHEHRFYYTWMSVENHRIECELCDYYAVTGHVVGLNAMPNALGIYFCSLCGGRTNIEPIIHPPGELMSV